MITNAHTRLALLLATFIISAVAAFSQTESATVSGRVTDSAGSVVPGTEVQLLSTERGTSQQVVSNQAGIYAFQSIQPGQYHMTIRKPGFRQIELVSLVVNVQDHIEKNFQLQVGSVSESVTVTAGAQLVNTEDASVSTVVDRNFAEELPMNGRSFQTLIELTPGVVLTASTQQDSGQFSVNGQRATSNYWMVDGVSANIGISSSSPPGNGVGGSLGSFSVLGGTNSLVSVDALQEFRIQTSTFAPEFGRTPGGQISIVTRSGTNLFHGAAFDYFRNDILDANNWFNGFTNSPALPKAKERQNDFGGTFSGPILKSKTFFFFSYEGLRLRLPQTSLTTVPDLAARQSALPVIQPYLRAFPFDPGQPDLGNGIAQFNASYSDPASLDAYSIRLDHRVSNKWSLFGRYNNSPSQASLRGPQGFYPLSVVFLNRFTTQTATVGATALLSPRVINEFRINYSNARSRVRKNDDNFGSATPLTAIPFPSPYTSQNATFTFGIFSLQQGFFSVGDLASNTQRQINLIDNLSIDKGAHRIKVGIDFRRLSPKIADIPYSQEALFTDISSAETGMAAFSLNESDLPATLRFRNLGAFAQDTWRPTEGLTVNYGLRWDVDFTPSSIEGPSLPAVTGFNLNNPSTLALAPAGTPPFRTTYGNLAPRLGVAFEPFNTGTVVRGGVGVFYDLATQEVGNLIAPEYPFGANIFRTDVTFPFSPAIAAPPPITPANLATPLGLLLAFDPHLKLPYTLEWNAAIEQPLGTQQTVSASYIASAGRKLIQTAQIKSLNPSSASANLVTNRGTSDYDALQLQFRRRLSHGFQALGSYTWSHSIDDASASSYGNGSNSPSSGENPNSNRGSSDFDIRHAFSLATTYDINAPKFNILTNALLRDWSLESIVQGRSAPPVDVFGFFSQFSNGFTPNVRPDVVPNVPLYLYGSQYPGGKIINNTPNEGGLGCIGPFCPQPTDPNTGFPLRQGNLARNALRAFGAIQWDFAVHRDFPLRESLRLQFRAEMFNVLNHPNFGPPDSNLTDPQFGLSTQMLGQSLGGQNVGQGGLSPLYQIGGPRSIQLALKLQF